MQGAQATRLPDGRLHLHHGPIDLIIQAWGGGAEQAYTYAHKRFETVLDELVAELARLRAPDGAELKGAVARRMAQAIAPYAPDFITPMAAVAGAVADEVLAAMVATPGLEKAFVNNGGDIALFLTRGTALTAAIHDRGDGGRVRLRADQPGRGLATSGWYGRSHSLGIADAVTVVATCAAAADAAATLIANAVDLPGHGAIARQPAKSLAPDSDLGLRLVTTGVGDLTGQEVDLALRPGMRRAEAMVKDGRIEGAALFLKDQSRLVGGFPALEPRS